MLSPCVAPFLLAQFLTWCNDNSAITLVLYYIDVAGVSHGLDPDFSFYLVSITNTGSGLGRMATGATADYFGPMNILIPVTVLAAGTIFAWPYCVTKGASIALALLYG